MRLERSLPIESIRQDGESDQGFEPVTQHTPGSLSSRCAEISPVKGLRLRFDRLSITRRRGRTRHCAVLRFASRCRFRSIRRCYGPRRWVVRLLPSDFLNVRSGLLCVFRHRALVHRRSRRDRLIPFHLSYRRQSRNERTRLSACGGRAGRQRQTSLGDWLQHRPILAAFHGVEVVRCPACTIAVFWRARWLAAVVATVVMPIARRTRPA